MPQPAAAPSGGGGWQGGGRGYPDGRGGGEREVRFQEPHVQPRPPVQGGRDPEAHSGLSNMSQGAEAQEQLKKKNERNKMYAQELQDQIKAKEEKKRMQAEEKKLEDKREEERIRREIAELKQETAGESVGRARQQQQPEARTSPTKPKERNPLLSPTADPAAPVQRFHSNNLGMTPDEIRKKVQAQAEIQAALKVQIMEKERQKKMAQAREKFEEEMEEQRVLRQQKEMRDAYLRDRAGLPPAPARGVTGEQGDAFSGVANSAAAVKAAAGASLGGNHTRWTSPAELQHPRRPRGRERGRRSRRVRVKGAGPTYRTQSKTS